MESETRDPSVFAGIYQAGPTAIQMTAICISNTSVWLIVEFKFLIWRSFPSGKGLPRLLTRTTQVVYELMSFVSFFLLLLTN